MKVSREGIVLIKSFEGFRPRAVRGADGRWIIGHGHTASAREGLSVDARDAELLLQYDLLPVVRALNEQAPDLNQHQFDALASFAVSVGVDRFLTSDVLGRLKAGQAGDAADALFDWPEPVSPDAGLRRRAAERALFVSDPATAVTLADLLGAPLPFPAVAEPAASPTPSDARAAAVATLLGEAPDAAAPASDAEWDPDAPPFPAPNLEPAEPLSAVSLSRYSPYGTAIIGPLPGFGPAAPAPAAVTDDTPPLDSAAASPEADAAPPAGSEPADSPAAGDPAPSTDAEAALAEDLPTRPVLRHEVRSSRPRRFDWGETGAFLFMGGLGLAACGAAAAAFRLATRQPSPMGETTVIAWSLAVIGVVCVSVSAWNLYVRWAKPD